MVVATAAGHRERAAPAGAAAGSFEAYGRRWWAAGLHTVLLRSSLLRKSAALVCLVGSVEQRSLVAGAGRRGSWQVQQAYRQDVAGLFLCCQGIRPGTGLMGPSGSCWPQSGAAVVVSLQHGVACCRGDG